MNIRVNCIAPDWIATERAFEQLARMTPDERANMPVPCPPEEIAAVVVIFVEDEELTGRVMVIWPGESPRLLDPSLRL